MIADLIAASYLNLASMVTLIVRRSFAACLVLDALKEVRQQRKAKHALQHTTENIGVQRVKIVIVLRYA